MIVAKNRPKSDFFKSVRGAHWQYFSAIKVKIISCAIVCAILARLF